MISPKSAVIGLDIGGVITEPPVNPGSEDAFTGTDHLLVPKVKDSFAVISELTKRHRVVIISRAGPTVQRKTTEWLFHHGFFQKTGVRERDIHYTLTRDEKTRIARREDVTHFVDDKLEVLGFMMGMVPNLYAFRAPQIHKNKMPYVASQVTHVDSWQELRRIFLP